MHGGERRQPPLGAPPHAPASVGRARCTYPSSPVPPLPALSPHHREKREFSSKRVERELRSIQTLTCVRALSLKESIPRIRASAS